MGEEKLKSGFVALIGRPNVGKSTLMNHLIGQKIAITSRKPQTTRNRIQTVYNDERGQIIFVDTPGLHKAKNKLGEYMVYAAESSLKDVDAVLWLIEAGEYPGAAEQHIAKMLDRAALPVILVVNKIDKVKKPVTASTMEAFRGLTRFEDVIAVSAKQRTNLDLLTEAVFRVLPYGPRFYAEDTVTDQPVRQIAAEMIREKALRSLGEEVPHGIAVVIEKMRERPVKGRQSAQDERSANGDLAAEGGQPQKTITDIEATIICERESHKGMIIGKQGSMLKKIGSEARADIEKLIDGQVNLKLWVKVRKDWRENDVLVKNFGYDRKELDE